MNLIETILIELAKTTINYKGFRTNLLGIPVRSQNSVKSTMNRLHKVGFIEKKNNDWQITPSGKKYLKRKENSLKHFQSDLDINEPKNLLVMYDIPEAKKAEREWFRWHLKKFGYKMIQRSVWVGPSPLPKEFERYLEKIKLKESIKVFKLAKPYKIDE